MILLLLTGCMRLASVSVTPVPLDRGQPVEAMVETPVIAFGVKPNGNDFAHEIVRDLMAKCPDGRVDGILTKHEFITYFLFVHKERITARGMCVHPPPPPPPETQEPTP